MITRRDSMSHNDQRRGVSVTAVPGRSILLVAAGENPSERLSGDRRGTPRHRTEAVAPASESSARNKAAFTVSSTGRSKDAPVGEMTALSDIKVALSGGSEELEGTDNAGAAQ